MSPMRWYGREVKTKRRAAARAGLLDAAEEFRGRAAARAPHEAGDLERDNAARVDDTELRAIVSFGEGPAAAYTVVQHEDITFSHGDGREAKFLERAVQGDPQLLERCLARRMKETHG